MTPLKQQTYSDGMVDIYNVENVAEKGNMPDENLNQKYALRYDERTVGLQRRYLFRQEQVEVKYVLRCQLRRDVSTQDVAIPNDGKQYSIKEIQYPSDVAPPSMDLTLEEVESPYDVIDRV